MISGLIETMKNIGIEVVVLRGSGEVAYFPQLKILYLHQKTSLEKVKTIVEYIVNNTPDFTPDLCKGNGCRAF